MSGENSTIGIPFEEFLDHISDPAFEINSEWQICYVNERMLKSVGRTRDKVLYNRFWEVFPEARGTKFESEYRHVLKTGESTTFEEYYSPLGIWVDVRAYPSERGVIVYYRDISGRKEAEADIGQHDAILRTIENGVFLANEELEFVDVNRAYCELSGYSREELVGSRVSKVISEANLATAIEIGETVIAEERSRGSAEMELETADGCSILISSKFVPFTAADGSIQTIGVVQDISDQKNHERTLTSLHDVSRKLVETKSQGDVCGLLVEAATDVLDFSGVIVYLYDDVEKTLVPTAHSNDVEKHYGSLLTLPATPDSSITANVFESGETKNVNDVTGSELLMNESVNIRSGLFIPLGEHGIIVIGDNEAGAFDEKTTELIDTLAATAESTLNRLERETRIRAREKMVTTLHDATRELMQAETKKKISQVAVTAATELLGLSSVGIFLWNEQQGTLEPSAVSPDIRSRFDTLPVFESGNSIAWETFIEGETELYTDLRDEDRLYNQETPFRCELIIPIGTHGIFLSASTSVDAYDETDVESAELLSANVGAALDRADREQNMREQERQLQVKNQDLTRINQINTVIRSVVQSIVRTTSVDQLRTRICEHLIEAEPYCFAWFATRNSKTKELEPRAWSEENHAYLETILSTAEGQVEQELPIERAFESGEPQVVENILAHEDSSIWRKTALHHGYQSAISVPVCYGNMTYGVLEVYGVRSSMFTDEEYNVFIELGDIIGNAMNAIERTEALLSGSDTELEFRIPETDDLLFYLAREMNRRIELEALVPSSAGSWLLYVLVDECDPKQMVETAEKHVTVNQVSHIRSKNDRELFGIVVSDLTSLATVAEHGGTLRSISIEDSVGSIVLTIPRTTDVRTFVETFLELLPSAEFVRRGQVEVPNESKDIARELETQLTDRQRESLGLAYQCGYFAWPRDRTGDEIAEMMGITSPTFHSHLRKGLNSLLGTIIDRDQLSDLTD